MASSHAASGAAAGIGVFSHLAVPLPSGVTIGGFELPARLPLALGLGDMSRPYVAVMCLVLAATALLPDWDVPTSHVSTCLPPVSGAVSSVLGRAGHRTLTHTPAGIALAVIAVTAASSPALVLSGVLVRPGNGIVIAVLAAVGARVVGASRPIVLWSAGLIGLAWGAALPATSLWFMPTAVGLGMWVHRVGDALTTRGVEGPLWPLLHHPRVRLPILGETGSRREGLLGAAMALYAIAGGMAMAVSAPA